MDKLLLKQAAVVIGCKFYVDDSEKNNAFTLKSASPLVVLDRFIGSIMGVPFAVNISESNTNDQLIMEKKLGFIFEKYEALREHKTIATIKRGKKMMSPKIDIHSIYGDFTIQSNVMARTFEIEKDGSIVAAIKKVAFSLKDAYEITNYCFEDIPLLIGIAFTLDNMFHN